MLLGEKTPDPVGSTVFKTGNRGWMGLGLRPVETWNSDTLREWTRMNPDKGEKEYLGYMRKFNRKHQMTPGVAAGTALMLTGHPGFLLPGRTPLVQATGHNFMDDLGMLSDCVGPLITALRGSFRTWCVQKERAPDLESFDLFISTLEPDLPIATKMFGLMNRMFYMLGPMQAIPRQVIQQPLSSQLEFGDELSNLSNLSNFSFLSS